MDASWARQATRCELKLAGVLSGQQLPSIGDLPPAAGLLVDLSGIAGVDMRVMGLADFFDAAARRYFRVALIAPRDLVFGVARQAAQLTAASEERIRTFREQTDAIAWLETIPGSA